MNNDRCEHTGDFTIVQPTGGEPRWIGYPVALCCLCGAVWARDVSDDRIIVSAINEKRFKYPENAAFVIRERGLDRTTAQDALDRVFRGWAAEVDLNPEERVLPSECAR